MKKLTIDLPKNLKRFRELKGLSQDELADMAGCSRQSISNYETDRQEPELEILARITLVLNLSMDTLTGLSGPSQATLEIMSNNFKTLHSAFVVIQNQLNQLAGAAVHPDVVTFFAALDPNQQLEILGDVRKSHRSEAEAMARLKKSSSRPAKSR